MKKIIALVLALAMVLSLAACGAKNDAPAAENNAPAADGKKVAAFVTFGLGGDFFQQLADEFVKQFTAAGWEASYADGEFNPSKQIEAAENYIAMGVDLLYIWSVAPEAMNGVIDAAMAKGIKVVAFVAATEKYDVVMRTDDVQMGIDATSLAAKWIDEHFADAPDHSVPVAVFSCRAAETGVIQADEMLKIENLSKKAKLVTEVECQDETQATGQDKMETLYIQNPEIQVFLSPHGGLALGINAYFTGLSSPVTDYTDMAIFSVNATEAIDVIGSSLGGASPFRGIVMTGGVEDTVGEMMFVANGIMDGSLPVGYEQIGETVYCYANPNTHNLDFVSGKLPE